MIEPILGSLRYFCVCTDINVSWHQLNLIPTFCNGRQYQEFGGRGSELPLLFSTFFFFYFYFLYFPHTHINPSGSDVNRFHYCSQEMPKSSHFNRKIRRTKITPVPSFPVPPCTSLITPMTLNQLHLITESPHSPYISNIFSVKPTEFPYWSYSFTQSPKSSQVRHTLAIPDSQTSHHVC